jgi:hypothetical protein
MVTVTIGWPKPNLQNYSIRDKYMFMYRTQPVIQLLFVVNLGKWHIRITFPSNPDDPNKKSYVSGILYFF